MPQVGIINPSEFSPANSIEAVIWVAVGGRGTLSGAILGAVLVNLGKTWFTSALPELWLYALGALFIFVTLLLPRGIDGPVRPARAGHRARTGTGAGRTTGRATRGDRMSDVSAELHDTLLYLDGVTVSFDGFRALNALSLVLEAGEMRAVIGPNGAGKTTMMDVITGKTRPDDGQGGVRQGHRPDAAGRTGDRLAGHRAEVPEAHGVRAAHRVGQSAAVAGRGPQAALYAVGARDAAGARAHRGDPGHHAADRPAPSSGGGDLSHGQKQWLEIGMLLAQEPQLLLVDEPVAGMTDAETEQTAELLREIHRTRSVVVVEHDMAFVRALDVKVTVLHEGSVLSEGSIDHVSEDPRVIEVYLGR